MQFGWPGLAGAATGSLVALAAAGVSEAGPDAGTFRVVAGTAGAAAA